MDPLTALSLAGNVIQFVEFGTKLLSQGYELYKSTGGKLQAEEELELITSDLSGLINKIQHGNTQKPPSTPTPTHGGNAQQPVFEKICEEATKIAQAILDKLEKLKIDDTKNRKFETFKTVWKRLWSQGEIDQLVNRLSRLKDVINTEALAAILQNTNELNVHTLARFDSLDQQTQLILASLLESNQATRREVMTVVAQLMGRLEIFDELADQHRRTREMIIHKRANDESLRPIGGITASVEILAVPQREEKALRADVQKTILEKLSYPAMPTRYEQVIDAYPTTFEWAFQDLPDESRRWANLASWLKRGNGLYWISGKPGSGKSTLMKHIYDDRRTRLYLERWAQMGESTPVPLLMGTFFFWNSGTLEQRSQIGMLRSVLFQILEQKPELLPVVFPTLWAKQYEKRIAGEPSVWSETWTLRLLMAAFRRLVAQCVIPTKIFFLIDGLDEFGGDHEVLAELFNDVVRASGRDRNDRIKCCVSSRPWVVFKENFEGCLMLQLQDLTVNDIETFVTEKTLANSAFRRLAEQEPQATSKLIQEIVGKAEGVFLWVHVVVIDLLRGIRKRDSVPDLWGRLEALPNDLESLYRHIMSQIEPAHLIWASKSFQIARAAREVRIPKRLINGQHGSKPLQGFISLGELYFALDESLTEKGVETMSQEVLDNKCRETEYHIIARCACLLEVIKAKDQSETTSSALVQYLHRTARDFLEGRDRWNEILDRTRDILFDPYWYMMRCNTLMLHWLSNQKSNRTAQQSWLRDTVIILLAFASNADAHIASHLQQKRILDDANNMMANHDIDLMSAHYTLVNLEVPKNMKTITACALGLNLSQYVAAELRRLSSKNPRAAKSTSTAMLSTRISADKFNATDGLPCINMRMASVLIEFGADVNYQNKKDGFTIWEEFLRQGLTKLSSPSKAHSCNPDFARLMGFFLRSGANPHVSVKSEYLRINLLEFLETYVRPNYFTEADHLHDEILKALKSTPPTPHDGNQDSNTSASSSASINTDRLSMDEAPILRPSESESKDHFLPAQDDDELECVSQDLSATLKSHLHSAEAAPSLAHPETELKKNSSSPHTTPVEVKPQKRKWWKKGVLASSKSR